MNKIFLPLMALVLACPVSVNGAAAPQVRGRYGSVNPAWGAAIALAGHHLIDDLKPGPTFGVLGRLATISPAKPFPWTAPLVRRLEAEGYTPEQIHAFNKTQALDVLTRASEGAAQDISADVASLVKDLSRAELGSDAMLADLAKLGEVSTDLEYYLSPETRASMAQARAALERRLEAAGKGRALGERMARMAEALGRLPNPVYFSEAAPVPGSYSFKRTPLRRPAAGAAEGKKAASYSFRPVPSLRADVAARVRHEAWIATVALMITGGAGLGVYAALTHNALAGAAVFASLAAGGAFLEGVQGRFVGWKPQAPFYLKWTVLGALLAGLGWTLAGNLDSLRVVLMGAIGLISGLTWANAFWHAGALAKRPPSS